MCAHKRTVASFGLLLGFAVNVGAASKSGTAAFSFLTVPTGARAAAMGDAFTSVPNDVQAIFYNPASLSSLASSQASFQHVSYVQGILFDSLAAAKANGDKGVSWGGSLLFSRVAGIPRTVVDTSRTDGFREEGDFSTSDMLAGGSLSGQMAVNLAVGATAKVFREDLADASATAGALDLGLLYEHPEQPFWNVGVSVQNVGMSTKFRNAAVKLPLLLRVGVSAQPFSQWFWSADVYRGLETEGGLNLGAEVTPFRPFSLRVGYQYALNRPELGDIAGFTAGVGFRVSTTTFDYAFVPLGDLGMTHRISLTFRLGRT